LKKVSDKQRLVDALNAFLDMYIALVESGDAGNWNPYEVDEVIQALEALGDRRVKD